MLVRRCLPVGKGIGPVLLCQRLLILLGFMLINMPLVAGPLVNLTLNGAEPSPIVPTPPVKTAPLAESQYQNLFKTLPALAVFVQSTLVLPREPKPLPQTGGVIAKIGRAHV